MTNIKALGISVVIAWALLLAMPITGQAQQDEDPVELYEKANELQSAGRYAEAIPYARRALEIEERRSGADHPNVGDLLGYLALLYQKQGRYADAEPFHKRSLPIREKTLGPNHPDVAVSLNNLAVTYFYQGRYTDAEPLYRRSLTIEEKAFGSDDPAVARSLSNLAELYRAQGRYAEVEPLHQRSLSIEEKTLGPDHPAVATSLNNLAELYRVQGRYADAEQLHRRSLAIRERVLDPNHSDVAGSLNNLALLYREQGRYSDAEPLYRRSLAINEKALGPDHPAVATSLNNLASMYVNQDRYADAEPLHRRSLAIREKALGPDHPAVATSLNNLAELYRVQGRYADAEQLHRRSLAIREKALGPDHPDVATSLNNLAWLYSKQGRYAESEPLHKRSLAIQEKTLGPNHIDVATSLNNLAWLYSEQGRYADALPLVRTSVQEGFVSKRLYLDILTGALGKSLVLKSDAIDESYQVVQRATSSSASNAINQLSVRFAAGNDELAQLVRREQDLSGENDSLDKILVAEVSKEPSKRVGATEQRIRDHLKLIAAERGKIQISLDQRFPDFAVLAKPKPISIKDTQALLADDEALVVFDFDAKSYAWVVTKTESEWVELKISGNELDQRVKTLRSSLTFDIDKPFDASLAHKMYEETIGAIADRLTSKKRISVVANGALTSLPLQLLIMNDPTGKQLKELDWLIRSYAVTNLPSVASLKTLRWTAPRSSSVKPMIAFADPIFSQEGKAQVAALRSLINFYEGGKPDLTSLAKALPQLPDTANEVRAIAEVLKADEHDLKLGILASETTIKQTNLDDYRIIYFATHGLVGGEVEKFAKVKAEPALALTIPEKPTELDDGLLTASEVAQLKLNADWVVLSACNTAAEDEPGAEALSGLARAFFYAGARSLVVSHWEVDSESAVRLMVGTFQAAEGDPKLSHAEALQQSILKFIENAKSDDDAHPRFWAPFVIVGEPTKRQWGYRKRSLLIRN